MAILDIGLSQIGAFANPFGAPSQGEWNLNRGVYTTKDTPPVSVVFFYETKKGEDPSKRTAIDQITDSGGRRVAIYEYPYRDGQRASDIGRKGETFNFNIKFHGDNYQDKLNDFLQIVNSGAGGTITHPVRGSLPVKFRDHEFIHRHDEWNAVTIRATFVEDNTDELAAANQSPSSQNSLLRSALQTLTNVQSAISDGIFTVGALLLLPNAILVAMKARLSSILGQFSRLMGQLAATFSTDAQLQNILSQASTVSGGVSNLTSGSTTAGTLPPVYQVGFDPTTQAAILAQLQAFLAANQITPQQAVFLANQIRQAISAAITEVETTFGNHGYTIVVQYRGLAIAIQQAVEAAIATQQSLVKIYTVPYPMSLRMVAVLNALTVDDQNTIEALNPYLASVNYLVKGTQVTVPVSS